MRLFNDDCFNVLPQLIDEGVKVDMVFADLPYKETGWKWDKLDNYELLFKYLSDLITDEGAMLFTGTFKFGMTLFNACPSLYKYEWVWEKEHGTNVPLVNFQPFRVHEYVYVFGKGRVSYGSKNVAMKYNPQKTKGVPYACYNQGNYYNGKGNFKRQLTVNKGDRHPKTIQFFKRDRGYHPTQKPVSMIEYFIKTYTDEGDTVLDFTMGSGSTGVACQNTNREFIGVELDKKYFEVAENRFKENVKQQKLI